MKRIYKILILIILFIGTVKTVNYNIELNNYLQENNLQRTIENAQAFDELKGYKTIYLD